MRRKYGLVLGLIISLVTLWLVFAEADWNQILAATYHVRLEFVALRILVLVLAAVVRGWRWSVLTQRRLEFPHAFAISNIGYALNNVLPGRLGELVRAIIASRSANLHASTALATILIERLFDFVAVFALLSVALLNLELPAWLTQVGALIGAGSLFSLLLLAAAARFPTAITRVIDRLSDALPSGMRAWIQQVLAAFREGLGGVISGATFVQSVLLTAVAWALTVLGVWALMTAFWDAPSLVVAIAVTAAAGFGVAVPAGPASIGTLESAVLVVLFAVHSDRDVSRSYALALHATSLVVVTGLGIFGFLREGLTLGQVTQPVRQPDAFRQSL